MPHPTELSAGPGRAPEPADDSVGMVVEAASTAEVAQALREAAAQQRSVVVRGRGTKLTWGRPPTSADVLLDVSGLDQVLDHAAGDLIVSTQAGALLCDVQEKVREGGQRLALDETVPGASIGGTLATNASGPLRVGFGTMRDLLIGVTVVRADGVVAKAGGRVVKNVAGYDLGKLLIGSFGTLAVVTEAVFRLHPRPDVRRWLAVDVGDPDQAQQRVQDVLHAQCVPAALEVVWTGDGGRVLVLLEGREAGVQARADVVERLWGPRVDTTDEPTATYPWDPTLTGEHRATALKLTHRLSGLADVLRTVRALDVPVRVRGSAGAGVLYAAIDAGQPVDAVRDAVDRLRAVSTRHEGAVVVVDAADEVKDAVDVWGPVPALDLMMRVKDRFDPGRRLAPGRFVGGI